MARPGGCGRSVVSDPGMTIPTRMDGGSGLSPEQRAVAELVLARGHSYEAISETLNLPVERVRQLGREAAGALGVGAGSQAAEAADRDEREQEKAPQGPGVGTAAVFVASLLLIVGGLVFFSVIGIAHV